MLKTKSKIESWLIKMNIKNYVINDDLTIDVNGDVDLSTKNLNNIPVQFGIVKGSFNCAENQLTSLKGAPYNVAHFFVCDDNLLTNLEYGPSKVNGSFYCEGNPIQSN